MVGMLWMVGRHCEREGPVLRVWFSASGIQSMKFILLPLHGRLTGFLNATIPCCRPGIGPELDCTIGMRDHRQFSAQHITKIKGQALDARGMIAMQVRQNQGLDTIDVHG